MQMKQLTDILLIAAVWVFVLDVSGFWNEASAIVKGWITGGLVKTPFTFKPFSCSLCMTFWTGIAYLLVTHTFTLPMLAWVCLCAMLTPRIADALNLISDLIAKLFNKISSL